jgi:phage recombination protein Bet
VTATDLAAPSVAQQLAEKPAIDRVNARQLQLIRQTVAVGASDAEIGMFLQLAGALDLNPFAREIWCAKGRGRDGEPGRLLILVGRDGLLKNANRYEDYLGYDCDVVRENDRFVKGKPKGGGETMRERAGVQHTYKAAKPEERGDIVGAWAIAERRGRPVRYFFANLSEYMPPPGKKRQYSPWGSSVSVMIEKVALSVVHRTLCQITGVLIEEEAAQMFAQDATPEAAEVLDPLLAGMPADIVERLAAAVEQANRLEAESWSAARCQMEMTGRSADELVLLAERIEAENADRLAAQPDARIGGDADEGDAEGEGEEHVTDAEVVDDPTTPDSGAHHAGAPQSADPGENAAKLEALQVRGRDLTARLSEAEDGSREADELSAELDGVEAEIRRLGGEAPGQDSLGL